MTLIFILVVSPHLIVADSSLPICQAFGDLVAMCRSTLQSLLLSTSPSLVHVKRSVDNQQITIIRRAVLFSIVTDRAWKSELSNAVAEVVQANICMQEFRFDHQQLDLDDQGEECH